MGIPDKRSEFQKFDDNGLTQLILDISSYFAP
jgi:hypothetical protein